MAVSSLTGISRVAVTLALVLAMALVTAACTGKDSPPQAAESPVASPVSTGPFAGATVPATFDTPTPDAAENDAGEPAPGAAGAARAPRFPMTNENAQLARLVIPRAKVNHRLVVKGLNQRREMEDPGGKDDVAWYNFSTKPGFGSNAVLSGHVDWYTGDRGVFWFLRDLKEGDEAEIQYSDGMVLKYRVTRIEVYGVNDAPVAEITGPTPSDTLTLITCDGVFQRSSQDYTQRRVVFAERVA